MEKIENGGRDFLNKRDEKSGNNTKTKVILELITYDKSLYAKYENLSSEEIIGKIQPTQVNWINLDGLHGLEILEKLQSHFCLHSLLIEDILNDQRPKAEEYDDYLFVTLKMLHSINGNKIDYEQISFVLGNNYLLTFQEKDGDLFDGLRERIRLDQGRVRKKKADYLLYRLIDIIIDSYYTVLDNLGEKIEEVEGTILKNPSEKNFNKIQSLSKELIFLRKAVFPLRDVVSLLLKNEYGFIEEENSRFYRDVYDHIIHLIDSLDTYKDLITNLTDMHINSLNTRLNEVIRVLTVISTIFMPLTFIVGVYGMNFDNLPELHRPNGYYEVWGVMLVLVITMLSYFKFKKWI